MSSLIRQNEADEVRRLQERLSAALASAAPVPPLWVAALAAYVPLHTLPFADVLLARDWPDAVRPVLLQQMSEPAEEARNRAAMPRLTGIEDASSQAVRAQYEVNPYPRWTKISAIGGPKTVEQYLRARFPLAPVRPLDKPKLEYLVAGCGTGQHVASVAQAFSNAEITAIDLSLTSLGYAKRMITGMGLQNITFGQADILELANSGGPSTSSTPQACCTISPMALQAGACCCRSCDQAGSCAWRSTARSRGATSRQAVSTSLERLHRQRRGHPAMPAGHHGDAEG